MRQKISKLMLLLVGATMALAGIGVGYGMWFDQLTITGQVTTGTIALSFENTAGVPWVTPYTNDDDVVNSANDPSDIGWCAYPAWFNDDGDVYPGGPPYLVPRVNEDPLDGTDNDGDYINGEDPAGDKNTDGCPGICSIDDDKDGLIDEGDDDDDEDGRVDEDPLEDAATDQDGDGLDGEDPVGKLSTCDPRSTPLWTVAAYDEDGDGATDEDPSSGIDDDEDGLFDEDPGFPVAGIDDDGDQHEDGSVGDPGDDECSDGDDNDGDLLVDAADSDCTSGLAVDENPAGEVDDDGDGLLDEDGLGGWDIPFIATDEGQDIGRATAWVTGGGEILMVDLANPTVNQPAPGVYQVYSPTVYAHVVNTGTVPVIVADYRITVTPPYELWDRDGNGSITNGGDPLLCDFIPGEECAAPLTAWLTKLDGSPLVGTVLDPNVPVAIKLKVSMTPAAKSTVTYGLQVTIPGAQYNEPL